MKVIGRGGGGRVWPLAVGLQSAVISQSCDWVLGLHLLLQLASLTAPIYLVFNQLGQAGPMHVSG